MKHNLLNRLTLLTCFLLGGCVSLFPENPQKTDTLLLSVGHQKITDIPAVSWQLTILEPTTSTGLDTDRVMVKRDAYRVSYVADVHWPNVLPVVVQDLLLDALVGSQRIKGISKSDGTIKADYALKTEIQKFELQESGEKSPPTVYVDFLFQLIKVSNQEVVSMKHVRALKHAEAKNPESVVTAFNAALTDSFEQMVTWILMAGDSSSRG